MTCRSRRREPVDLTKPARSNGDLRIAEAPRHAATTASMWTGEFTAAIEIAEQRRGTLGR